MAQSSAPNGVYDAAKAGDVNKLREILHGDPRATTITDSRGRTALHAAAERGNLQCVHLLLEVGAETDAVDNEGWTPLQLAVPRGNLQVVELLLLKGADTKAVAVVVHMAAVVVRSHSAEPLSKLIRTDKVVDVGAVLLAHGATCWIGHAALPAAPLISSCSRLIQSLSTEAVAEAQERVDSALAARFGEDPHRRLRAVLMDRRARGALAAAASAAPLSVLGRRRFVSVETFARARSLREAAERAEEDARARCVGVLEQLVKLRRARAASAGAAGPSGSVSTPNLLPAGSTSTPDLSGIADGAFSRRCSTADGEPPRQRARFDLLDACGDGSRVPWEQLLEQATEHGSYVAGADETGAWDLLAPTIAEASEAAGGGGGGGGAGLLGAGAGGAATREDKLAYSAVICVGRWAQLQAIRGQAVRAEAAASAAVEAEQQRAAAAMERLREEHAKRAGELAAGPGLAFGTQQARDTLARLPPPDCVPATV